MQTEKSGELNLLLIHQSYLVRKIQRGDLSQLRDLKVVQLKILNWYEDQSAKIKLHSKCKEINSSEPVRIYHHELHSKHIKRSSIVKLEADGVVHEEHTACAQYLEKNSWSTSP